jgi:hypothetical protein
VTSADFQASDCSAYNVCTTTIPSVSDLRPPEARHGDQAEDGSIRPLPWEYLFREAAE